MCKIYTVVVATGTYHKALRSLPFKQTLVQTAIEAIEEIYDEKFDLNSVFVFALNLWH